MTEKILIVDDDPDIIKFIEVNLRLEGYEIEVARDGEEALSKALEEVPDLILLDVMMPKLDGFEVCRQLREDPRTFNISVIMLTAKTLSADKVVGLTAGADDYMSKPFDPMELVARVKSTLRRAKQMRDRNPLSGLPGNVAISRELEQRVASEAPLALMHVDLDNFKSFNDFYGFLRGDEAIKMTAKVLVDAARTQDGDDSVFVGHVGGDDFVVICDPGSIDVLAKTIIESFDSQIPSLYDTADRERGYIETSDRHDQFRRYPLMTISLGVAANINRKFTSHLEATEVANEMKSYAKRQPESSYAVDRRRDSK